MTEGGGSIKAMGLDSDGWIFWFVFSNVLVFKLIFLGMYLLYSVVLVSAIQENESAIGMPVSPPFGDFFPFQVTSVH